MQTEQVTASVANRNLAENATYKLVSPSTQKSNTIVLARYLALLKRIRDQSTQNRREPGF